MTFICAVCGNCFRDRWVYFVICSNIAVMLWGMVIAILQLKEGLGCGPKWMMIVDIIYIGLVNLVVAAFFIFVAFADISSRRRRIFYQKQAKTLNEIRQRMYDPRFDAEKFASTCSEVRFQNQKFSLSDWVLFEEHFAFENTKTDEPVAPMDETEEKALTTKMQMLELRYKNSMEELRQCFVGAKCFVCLSDFEDRDQCIRHPLCNHVFHSNCFKKYILKCANGRTSCCLPNCLRSSLKGLVLKVNGEVREQAKLKLAKGDQYAKETTSPIIRSHKYKEEEYVLMEQ